MVDHISPERRSWLMSRVSSKNTSPEMRVRQLAHSLGLRFRLHRRDLPGKPDLVFPKHQVVVFVHGCFWHRHTGCSKASTLKSREAFWTEKFDRNQARDLETEKSLKSLGWRVHTIWECDTKNEQRLRALLAEIFEGRGQGG